VLTAVIAGRHYIAGAAGRVERIIVFGALTLRGLDGWVIAMFSTVSEFLPTKGFFCHNNYRPRAKRGAIPKHLLLNLRQVISRYVSFPIFIWLFGFIFGFIVL
jgi:hypothetical protein